MKRLLIVGASIPLPTDELRYEDTWIYLIKNAYSNLDIVDKCVRGRSMTTLMHGGPGGKAKNVFEWYDPDYIILHLGLSDCAPRLLPRKNRLTKIINHLPFSNLIYSYFRKHGGRRIKYADLSPKEFEENLEGYIKRVAPVPVGIIQISKVSINALKKSPQFNDAIDQYNSIIDKVIARNHNAFLILGIDGSDSSLYQSDGIHFLNKGQQVFFKRCSDWLKSLIESK